MDIASEEEAMSHGWTEIEPAFALAEANYCGIYPDCRDSQET
jgi:hypothetical protein